MYRAISLNIQTLWHIYSMKFKCLDRSPGIYPFKSQKLVIKSCITGRFITASIQEAENSKPIVGRDQHYVMSGQNTAVELSLVYGTSDQTSAVNPKHYWLQSCR